MQKQPSCKKYGQVWHHQQKKYIRRSLWHIIDVDNEKHQVKDAPL